MTDKYSFSIVTPSFNQAPFIGEALESVRQQNWTHVEHVVFDGGSSDGTVEALSQYSGQQHWGHLRWTSEADRGQGHALNKGFAAVSGGIVGWLNSDDRYLPGCFARVAKVFDRYPEVDIVYGDYRCIDQGGNIQRVRREIEFSRFVLLYHRVLYIPTTTTFFRRRILDQGHFLDERLHFALDAEYFMRLARNGFRFRHVRALLADFRFQPDSKTCSSRKNSSRRSARSWRNTLPCYKRCLGRLHDVALEAC